LSNDVFFVIVTAVIKQAVILSAGLGTRMGSLTDNVPKVMVSILGKPLLLWHIEQFKKHGVKEFFINLHYLPDVVKDYFGDGSKFGVKINYSFEPTILGTAGGLKKFSAEGGSASGGEDKLDDEFFLIYGDTFSLVDYSKMVEFFSTKLDAIGIQRVGLLGYRTDVDLVELGANKRLIKIHPKPNAPKIDNLYSMRGIFILKKKILESIPPDVYYEIGKDLLPHIIGKEAFYGYECDGYSKGIDTLEKLSEVEHYLNANHITP